MSNSTSNSGRGDQPDPRLRPATSHDGRSAQISSSPDLVERAPGQKPQRAEGSLRRWWRKGGRVAFRITGAVGLCFLLSCCFPFWLVFFATWPAYPVATPTVTGADGTTHKLTILHADPVIPLPFNDSPEAY